MSAPTLFGSERVPRPRSDAAAEGALDTVIDEACRTLHLPTIRARYEDIAEAALRDRSSYKDFLADLSEADALSERNDARFVWSGRRTSPDPNGLRTSTSKPIPTSRPRW